MDLSASRIISYLSTFAILILFVFIPFNVSAAPSSEPTSDPNVTNLAAFLMRDASPNYVVINEAGIAPLTITIQVGERVTWHNSTGGSLQLTSGTPEAGGTNSIFLPFTVSGETPQQSTSAAAENPNSTPVDDEFGGALVAGADYHFTFTQVGTYPYYISGDNPSSGTVIVEAARPTTVIRTSPANGEDEVAVTRETIIEFERPLSSNVIPEGAISTHFGGQELANRLLLSADRERVTVHYTEPLPANARIRLTINGDQLTDNAGNALDPDGDGVVGGTATITFDTLSLSRIPNTDVWGYVYDSYNKNADGSERPIVGATIRLIDLPDLFAVTDDTGYFILEDVPAPTFFVDIDGSTATNAPSGTSYASVGKPFHSVPGQSRQLFMDREVFDIYLPTMDSADVQQLSSTAETIIGFGESGQGELSEIFSDLDPTVITNTMVIFPPNSAIDENGNPTSQGAIIPVNAERLPAPLPPGMNHQLDIAVMAPGANSFDQPAPACFPNLPDPDTGDPLAPGAKSALVSFNHDTGVWDVVGSMTVTDDGKMVCTDPRVGIRAPGWHGSMPTSWFEGAIEWLTSGECGAVTIWAAADCLFSFFPLGGCATTIAYNAFATYRDCYSDDINGTSQDPIFGKYQGCAITGIFDSLGVLECFHPTSIYGGQVIACTGAAFSFANACLINNNAVARTGPQVFQAFEPFKTHVEILEVRVKLSEILFGGEIWTDIGFRPENPVEHSADVDRILEILVSFARPTSEGDVQITEKEMNSLITQPFPQGIDKSDIVQLSEYWNRTNSLWKSGVTTHADAGRTDFIDLIQLENALDMIEAKIRKLDDAGISQINPRASFELFLQQLPKASTITYSPKLLNYALVDVSGGVVQRGKLAETGLPTVASLRPDTFFLLKVFDPTTNKFASVSFTSSGAGTPTRLPNSILDFIVMEGDRDIDGLADLAEEVIGTSVINPDTDNDGIPDGVEIRNGTDPLDGFIAQTGIVGSADTPGTAVDLCLQNDQAFIADGEAGLAILNLAESTSPTIITQIDTSGNAQRVACGNGHVAVADSEGGLTIVDTGDIENAQIIHQIALTGTVSAVAVAGDVIYAGSQDGHIAVIDARSGALQAEVDLGQGVHDLFIEGDVLYALTADSLHLFSIETGGFQKASSIRSPIGVEGERLRRLFVGNGLAYATHSNGYNTHDVTDIFAPKLIASGDSQLFGWKQMVPNGSGLGMAAVSPNSTNSGPHHISLYDTSDPTQTDTFFTQFETPGLAEAVAIHNGLAYVADSAAGLQIINYMAYDSQGISPTLTLSSNFAPGVAEEAVSMRITAQVIDDIQVRNVEFYIDGQLAAADGSFPFEYRFTTPQKSQQSSFKLRVRAVDTGGNDVWSEEETITLVDDATPPKVTATAPTDDGFSQPDLLRSISVTFSEAMDATRFNNQNFRLIEAGPDKLFETSDDQPIIGMVEYKEESRSAIMTFDAGLPEGDYQAVLTEGVTDQGGNSLVEGDYRWSFQVAVCLIWDLSTDFISAEEAENPMSDSCGNAGVWHLLSGPDANQLAENFQLMPNHATAFQGTESYSSWEGNSALGSTDKVPFIAVNLSNEVLQQYTIVWGPNQVVANPGPGEHAIIGWKSPISGTVTITGSIANVDYTTNGSGIIWSVQKENTVLASNEFPNGTIRNVNALDLTNISVQVGTFVYFILDPNGGHEYDANALDITILDSSPDADVQLPEVDLSGNWYQEADSGCKSTWTLERQFRNRYSVTEAGCGNATGIASIRDNRLTIHWWISTGCHGYYSWVLDDAYLEGDGELVYTSRSGVCSGRYGSVVQKVE